MVKKKDATIEERPQSEETTVEENTTTEHPEEIAVTEKSEEIVVSAEYTAGIQLTSKFGIENPTPDFLDRYKDELQRLEKEEKSKSEMQQTLLDLPEDLQEKMSNIYRSMSGKKRGAIGGDTDTSSFLALRLYHGVGSDPMRPEDLPVGNFYSSAGNDFGKEFVGTVLAYTKGRAMLGDKNQGEDTSRPLCSSWDRKVGNSYGNCDVCPFRPWKDGKPNRCGNDILFYILDKDMTGIYTLRFSKTSEGGGRQLEKLAGTTFDLWSRWYRIYAEKQKSADGKMEYRVLKATPYNPPAGETALVPDELQTVCEMLSHSIVSKHILPRINAIYQDGAKARVDEEEGFGATPPEEGGDGDFSNVDTDSLSNI
jgi:hypothetical protein